MRVTLRLYGNLRKYNEGKRETSELDIGEGTTIKRLLETLGVPEDGWWMAAVNDQVVDVNTVLRESDVVEVFEPVGGG
jgi:sulfur carrier protein ThiS